MKTAVYSYENLWVSENVLCNVLSVSLWHCDVGITVVPTLLLSKLRLPENVELSQHMAEWDPESRP